MSFISLSGKAGRETQREKEVRGRDKQEKDDNEGIVWVHMDLYDRRMSHEGWPQEICVITMSGNFEGQRRGTESDILKWGCLFRS